MHDTDKKRFAACITETAAAFHLEAGRLLLRAYFEALGDLEIDEIERACKLAVKTLEFFPRPVKIRKLCAADIDAQALEAWGQVNRAAHGNGEITDPIATEAVRSMGGVKSLRVMPEAEFLDRGHRRFIAAYRDLAIKRAAAPEPAPMLALPEPETGPSMPNKYDVCAEGAGEHPRMAEITESFFAKMREGQG